MDILTAFPYVGIILLVVINAVMIIKKDVIIDEEKQGINQNNLGS